MSTETELREAAEKCYDRLTIWDGAQSKEEAVARIERSFIPLLEKRDAALKEQFEESERIDADRVLQIEGFERRIDASGERIKELEAGYDRCSPDEHNMAWGRERQCLLDQLTAAQKKIEELQA